MNANSHKSIFVYVRKIYLLICKFTSGVFERKGNLLIRMFMSLSVIAWGMADLLYVACCVLHVVCCMLQHAICIDILKTIYKNNQYGIVKGT